MKLGAYQHHAFLDWRILPWDENWAAVHDALAGAGVESVNAQWEEMFGTKEEIEAEKPERPAKKRTTKKKATGKKKKPGKKPEAKKKTG